MVFSEKNGFMTKNVCEELKLCVNSAYIQQTTSPRKGKKHAENIEMFYFSKGKCFISKINLMFML